MPAEWDGIICISAGISNSHNAVEQANIEAQFEARAGFPNVIGAIDCTHIVIKVPSHDKFTHFNKKYFHSFNVQIVCDAQMLCGGGLVQRTIHTFSKRIVGNTLQVGTVRDGWLLGDVH